MKSIQFFLVILSTGILFSCLPIERKPPEATMSDSAASVNNEDPVVAEPDSGRFNIQPKDSAIKIARIIQTGKTRPAEIVEFAKTLIGVPYKYASANPSEGFDCSGFITHVFNHFKINVPRSSIDFTNVGREIDPTKALPGDLVLFTGTDSTLRVVGHMGIIISNDNGNLEFIHSSSGKANGVVITPLQRSYKNRFEKIIRVFPDEAF